MSDKINSSIDFNDIKIIEDLIITEYRKYKTGEKVKAGDIVKMIEQRRKLLPIDSDQKKFWKMIDKIRKEEFNSTKEKPKPKEKAK